MKTSGKTLYVKIRSQVDKKTILLGRRAITKNFKKVELNKAELEELDDKLMETKEVPSRVKKERKKRKRRKKINH